MRTLIAGAAALMLLGSAPAVAMGCCGATKGRAAMCAKDGMKGGATSRTAMKGKGCCCEGMSPGRMSRRG